MKKLIYIIILSLVSIVLISCETKKEPNYQFSTFDPPKFELSEEQKEAIKEKEERDKWYWSNRLIKSEIKIDEYLKENIIKFETYGEISIDELPPLDEKTKRDIISAYLIFCDYKEGSANYNYFINNKEIKYYYGTYSGRIFFSIEHDYYFWQSGSNYGDRLVYSETDPRRYPPYIYISDFRLGTIYPACPMCYEIYVYYNGVVKPMIVMYAEGEISHHYVDAATYFIAQVHPTLYDPTLPEITPRPTKYNLNVNYFSETPYLIYDPNSTYRVEYAESIKEYYINYPDELPE